ncbi:diacylglycerol/lipid kinase family protein [Sphingomonas gellani]|uniref:diacylglycerol/lipid kinase family protein n=1 Tax=Sphingomonas gellani TaxID=1166340 RepID=UPI00147E2CDD|nr:diacylglycerol kinase family protein [Sphingomonas gellani]
MFEAPSQPVGVILNGRAHRNAGLSNALDGLPAHVAGVAPVSRREMDDALARFAARGVETLIVSGGDGTVRDVLTAAAMHFRTMPRVAVVPSGKTNALAIDLGVPKGWTLDDAIRAADTGNTVSRAPIVVERIGRREPALRGFLFGAGAFVRATALAQDTHKLGAFNGLAVGLTLTGAVAQTLFGGRNNNWRRGDRMRIELADGRCTDRNMYLLLGSTLTRLPLGIKPFGRARGGLKLLGVDAPPKLLAATVPAVLAGSEARWIEARGYHRADTSAMRLHIDSGFVLDGERYEGGDMMIREGDPIEFLVPAHA